MMAKTIWSFLLGGWLVVEEDHHDDPKAKTKMLKGKSVLMVHRPRQSCWTPNSPKKKLHNPAWPLVHNAEDIWHTKRWTQGEGSRECCLRLLDEWGAPLAGSAFREEFKRFAIESDLVWLAQMARQYEVFFCGRWYHHVYQLSMPPVFWFSHANKS